MLMFDDDDQLKSYSSSDSFATSVTGSSTIMNRLEPGRLIFFPPAPLATSSLASVIAVVRIYFHLFPPTSDYHPHESHRKVHSQRLSS
jgi:hypothetical protein